MKDTGLTFKSPFIFIALHDGQLMATSLQYHFNSKNCVCSATLINRFDWTPPRTLFGCEMCFKCFRKFWRNTNLRGLWWMMRLMVFHEVAWKVLMNSVFMEAMGSRWMGSVIRHALCRIQGDIICGIGNKDKNMFHVNGWKRVYLLGLWQNEGISWKHFVSPIISGNNFDQDFILCTRTVLVQDMQCKWLARWQLFKFMLVRNYNLVKNLLKEVVWSNLVRLLPWPEPDAVRDKTVPTRYVENPQVFLH